jgi:ribosome-binding protein aMBF1 (putative translation factor)
LSAYVIWLEGCASSAVGPCRYPVQTPAEQAAYLRRLGLHIRVLRTALQLSQDELAARASMDRTYVSRLERGQHNVTVLVLVRLAGALGVAGGELLP